MGLSSITKIPGIMRAQGWSRGPALMDKWFGRPAAVAPAYSAPDTTTVTMKWVLGFARAKAVYDGIFADKVWSNAAARPEVRKMLAARGALTGRTVPFDSFANPPTALEAEYVNYRSMKSAPLADPLDDMYAALGSFNFRVVIAGEVRPGTGAPGAYEVAVTKVGVFVRDSYDFNDDPSAWTSQSLGCWDDSTNTVSKVCLWGNTTNKDFRDWRAKSGKGGDFLVYSDLDVKPLPAADVFTV